MNQDIYTVNVSTRKNKKYDVFKNGRYLLSFGDARYEQYKDKLGHYKHLDHNDKERRKRYYARHGPSDDINSSKFWSHNFLW